MKQYAGLVVNFGQGKNNRTLSLRLSPPRAFAIVVAGTRLGVPRVAILIMSVITESTTGIAVKDAISVQIHTVAVAGVVHRARASTAAEARWLAVSRVDGRPGDTGG
jgi:hypothetical protein